MATVATTATTGQTGAGGGNMIRITGMASGLDVDSLVKKMLTSDQLKIDSNSKATQTVQWQKDAYTSIISGINDLQKSFFDVTNSSTSMLSDTAYTSLDVVAIVPPTAATISVDGTAQAGAYAISFTDPISNVTEVHLATAAAIDNSAVGKLMTNANPPASATNSSKLSDLGFLANSSHSLTFTYNNNDGSGVKTKSIAITGDTTLSGLTDLINSSTNNGVVARFSELTGKLSIATASTGSLATLTVTADTQNVLKKLNLTTDWNATSLSGTGNDANVWITPPGGASTKTTQSSNNFTLDGVSYNLTALVPSTFSVVSNPQKVYDKISGFLDKYNGLVGQIQTAVNAKKDSAFPPLTAAQQTSMSATDIANWNAKAQVGVLRNDSNLTKMLNDMRTAFITSVTNTGLSFGKYGTNAIGLDTSTDVTQGGKITIVNKDQLMSAITNHPAQVKQMFSNVPAATITDPTQKYNAKGIFTRLNDIIVNNVGMIGTSYNTATLTQFANVQDNYSTTGGVGKNTLPDQLFYQQQLVAQLNTAMAADSTKYYKQFSALEVAMSNMSAQMSMLSNYTG